MDTYEWGDPCDDMDFYKETISDCLKIFDYPNLAYMSTRTDNLALLQELCCLLRQEAYHCAGSPTSKQVIDKLYKASI